MYRTPLENMIAMGKGEIPKRELTKAEILAGELYMAGFTVGAAFVRELPPETVEQVRERKYNELPHEEWNGPSEY